MSKQDIVTNVHTQVTVPVPVSVSLFKNMLWKPLFALIAYSRVPKDHGVETTNLVTFNRVVSV